MATKKIANNLVDEDTGEILASEDPNDFYQSVPLLTTPFFKTPFNHDTNVEAAKTALYCKDPTRTQQHLAAEQDINNILAKFMKTGELNLTGTPTYIEQEFEFDLQDAIVTRHQVDEAWNELPTAVRNILKDPKTFMEYVDHCMRTGDIDPLRELGLAKPITPPEPPKPQGGTPAPEKADGPSDGPPKAPTGPNVTP